LIPFCFLLQKNILFIFFFFLQKNILSILISFLLQVEKINNYSFLDSSLISGFPIIYYIINHIENFHIFPVNESRFLDSHDLFCLKNSFCILSFSFLAKYIIHFVFLL
jgi:hypothetical protein